MFLIAAVAALALAGCGGGSEGDVRGAIEGYMSALADGDGDEACSHLSGEMKRRLADAAGNGSCPEVVEMLAENFGEDDKSKLKDVEVVDIKIKGDTATAGVKGGDSTAELTKTDGDWLISGGFDF
jgi:hypothetical protein